MISLRLARRINSVESLQLFLRCKSCKLLYPTVNRALLRSRFSSSTDDSKPTLVGPNEHVKKEGTGLQSHESAKADDDAESLASTSSSSESDETSSSDSEDSSSSDEESAKPTINPKLVSAVDQVAKSLRGDQQKTKSDLLKQLQGHVQLVEKQKKGLPLSSTPELSTIMTGMKTQSSRQKRTVRARDGKDGPDTRKFDRASQRKLSRDNPFENFKLFQETALGIFSSKSAEAQNEVDDKRLSIFDEIEAEDLKHSMNFPPVNAFDEMINWTNEGKMWRYPIDNEQGLDEEAEVGFHEHVFLGSLLKDFPKKGPVRHFMELVTTGLSKNPYLTIAQKHEHVEWYKEYFKDKYTLIDELTVLADEKNKLNQ